MYYTTLEIELERMRGAVVRKLASYKPDRRKDLESQIYSIFKSSSRSPVVAKEEEKLREVIRYALHTQTPITVSFLFAVYWMAQSPYKFLQPEHIEPRLGDYWFPCWLDLIHQKVSRLHAPGCIFVIAEEFPMVHEMGWTKEQATVRRALLGQWYAQFPCVRVVDLPDNLPLPKVGTPTDAEVFAILLSTPVLLAELGYSCTTLLSDFLYVHHNKDYGVIRSLVPQKIWDRAVDIKIKMMQHGQARRSSGWLDKLMGTVPYVDAALIGTGRWCPDAWSWAFPQHGGSVLDTSGPNRYSISVVPEQRLAHTHTPVYLKTNSNEEYILYWLSRESQTSQSACLVNVHVVA